jgi:hypothetical protein
MKFNLVLALLLTVSMWVPTGAAIAKTQELPQVTEDGLHLVPDSKMAIVYAEPGANLAQYNKVKLLDAYVAFKKNWARNQRSGSANPSRISSKDIEKIKNSLSQGFHDVFRKTLEDGGYEVVDESAEDVLLVRPAIINLDVTAPDTAYAGRSTTYTSSAGEMTLYIELFDSVTGDLIAKALDRKVDNASRSGYYTWTNSVTNKSAGNRILKGWASILLDALNEARQ